MGRNAEHVMIVVRVPQELRSRINDVAYLQRRSVNTVLSELIEAYCLKHDGQFSDPPAKPELCD